MEITLAGALFLDIDEPLPANTWRATLKRRAVRMRNFGFRRSRRLGGGEVGRRRYGRVWHFIA